MGPSTTVLMDRTTISKLIDSGRSILIYNKTVLKLDTWLKYHPGGDKTILHLVGRDATDQIIAFHSEETKKNMLRYQIGVIEGKWDNITPLFQRKREGKNILELMADRGDGDMSEVDSSSSSALEKNEATDQSMEGEASASSNTSSTSSIEDNRTGNKETAEKVTLDEDAIVQSFRELVSKLEREGLYDCNYWAYMTEVIRISIIFFITLYLLHLKQYVLSSIFMGTFWHQLVFLAHDAGHLGITHSYQIDTFIGLLISSTLGGLSLSWWKTSHNVHHIATNSPSHDPDIQHLPFLAISTAFFDSLYSTYYSRVMAYTSFAETMMRYQHWLYYPLLCFGRFNLYVLSWDHLLLNRGPKGKSLWWHRPFEICGQLVFWYWFGYLVLMKSLPDVKTRITYLLISHAVTMPLHVQFTLSHFAMGTSPPSSLSMKERRNESWPMQQLRTTMDVACPSWMDWFHGGLQFQAIHHLFPRLPRHNLRKTGEVVKVWARESGVRYEVHGFVECNGRVLGRLEEVGRQARMMGEAHREVVRRGEWLRGKWE